MPEPTLLQPVEESPVICSPYVEPTAFWEISKTSVTPMKQPGRRPSAYWFKEENIARNGQTALELEEDRRDLVLVNKLRADVKRWRESNWESATNVTKDLLRHWTRPDRARRLFFCQVEAAETIIYLNEVRGIRRDGSRGKPRFNPAFSDEDFDSLIDTPADDAYSPLTRYCTKLATGAGKTVVMAMLITWAFCNRGRLPSDTRFPKAALICCPNLTIKERLQVLRTDTSGGDYYTQFDMVPMQYRDLLRTGKVLITNWHGFAPESMHDENGKSYGVVNKGPESDEAFAVNRLGELADMGQIMVLNDEAHHAYRPAPVSSTKDAGDATAKKQREEATIWVQGLDRINYAVGIQCCVDLSATPFYIKGSGYPEGEPLPWIVSDFGLVDAIESGITKIPRLPVSDTTGKPDPKYFRLWKNITTDLAASQRTSNKRPKPEVVWQRAEDALQTLAGEYQKAFTAIATSSENALKAPPVMILVCDNTDIGQLFFEKISGQIEIEDAIAETDDVEDNEKTADTDPEPVTARKAKKRTTYGEGDVFPHLLSNERGRIRTLRIDSNLLDKIESEDPATNRDKAARELREVVNSVGKLGQPGQDVRCVVSVSMLTEGWDANNVTHILGLRAFGSQLLCEQVVGRGLRRMNYEPDPETGLFPEEYVDVYGIPFSVIPYKGKKTNTPPDQPVNRVRALRERQQYEIFYPNVEGYVYSLNRPFIKADIGKMERLVITPEETPTSVFVRPSTAYTEGAIRGGGLGEFVEHDRQEYYALHHIQQIEFLVAQQIVSDLVGEGPQAPVSGTPKLRGHARHQLFPQVLRFVHKYVETKIDWRNADNRELGLEKYVLHIKERMLDAIEPDIAQGEAPLLPLLNRFKPVGSTKDVDFTTKRPVHSTVRSHVDAVVLDSGWEQSVTFYLEQLAVRGDLVKFYVRNDRPFLFVNYEYEAVSRNYEPDYIVRLANGVTVLLEVKGQTSEESRSKHQAANRWCSAVNNWGKLGKWDIVECKDPAGLSKLLKSLI
jgi:type III restriction enzyme